jgi:DNA adenine methylase
MESEPKNTVLSPLRYPGSKRKLVNLIWSTVAASPFTPTTIVEPMCGGASVSLGLLDTDRIQTAHINDADPLVHAFWKVCAYRTNWLVNAMWEEPITVDRWEHHKGNNPRSERDKALQCLFLNRTTFSGLMHHKSGPIGGKKQLSTYKIDCRFNRKEIEKRLRWIGQLADQGRLSVSRTPMDYAPFIESIDMSKNALIYLDPPYVDQGNYVYEWALGSVEHKELVAFLEDCEYPWILSYDDHQFVRDNYAKYSPMPASLYYSISREQKSTASMTKRNKREELLITNF